VVNVRHCKVVCVCVCVCVDGNTVSMVLHVVSRMGAGRKYCPSYLQDGPSRCNTFLFL